MTDEIKVQDVTSADKVKVAAAALIVLVVAVLRRRR
jgi:MYXO-CTERM domain-containing protein